MINEVLLLLMVIKKEFPSSSDEALMVRFGEGDASAFETLLNRYEKRVFCFIRRYVLDDQTAADLLQETFMKVIGAADRYVPSAKFSTWLLRIARNLCIDHSRRRKPEKLVRDAAGRERLTEVVVDTNATPDQHVQALEIRHRLELAVEKLPPKQREVFVLRQMIDLSFKDIAGIVNASENTVKSRMRYALASLRLELHGLYHQEAPMSRGNVR